ncbi:MAG: sulfatase [Verrucomicrobiota bacterium]
MRIPILFLLLCASVPLCEAQESPRPNILMIAIDDLNDWIGCLGGHPQAKTPHIDKLAASGRLFTNAHCSVPVCSPSRVSVMSGIHATTHGSYELGPAYEILPALKDAPTIQEYFKANGYKTITGGKILHHGFRGRLAAANDVQLDGRKGGPRPKKWLNWDGRAWDWGPFPETDDEMFDYQLALAAAEELSSEHEKPFFLSVGFFRPHVPLYVPPKWFEMYPESEVELPLVPDEDMDDVPPNFQYKMGVAPTHAEIVKEDKWKSLVQSYLASVSFVDHCVGEVIRGLENGPNKSNTIVVLWSDHGFHLGEKQHLAKRTLWEESTRVPLIITGPDIEPGDCTEAVSLLDIYPTLVQLSGLPQNPKLEGLSLVPQLRSPEKARSRPALTSSYFGNHSLRTKNWRYIRYADGAEELYDHREDPHELTNLAKDPAHKSVKKRLSKWLPNNAAPEFKPLAQQEQNLRRPKASNAAGK